LFAEFYDAWQDRRPQKYKTRCVETLVRLADGGPALELAIGTGRIALPLAAAGVRVSGVDNSAKMLERLHAKAGAEHLTSVLGNFADVPLDGPFSLIYVVLSFGYLLTQEEQLRCFMNASRKLSEGGSFVIQTALPGVGIFSDSSRLDEVFDIPATDATGSEPIMLIYSKADRSQQLIDQRFVVLGEAGQKIYRDKRRYVWPAELDLMARIAGLKLHARWGGWDEEPFTANSATQVSIYRRSG
jgi:SAM-dependent methyltransferase